MKLEIVTKNDVPLSEEAREYAEKRIGKLSRFLPTIGEGKVEVSREKAKQPEQRFVVQVTLDSRGVLIRAQEKAESTNAAVDKVAEALTSRIRRYKGKLYDKGRGLSLARQEAVEGAEGAGEAEGPRAVVKNKNFIVKTMTEDEAIGQMELLGHDFFLFVSDASGKMNLLYRRKDGNYGLIEPQLG